ncbi:MAG: tetratricopeptide repeat protein, partial [Deltaproteobacteria bacterium]|nr:tetratricopeptide repeat protein [Deltaproteobacteria bacterium]
MAFGWFSKEKGPGAKVAKAEKLRAAGRWAEALAYYEEALEAAPQTPEATEGARSCRERLVALNLEEARAFAASEREKAREHASLALELAAGEEDLRQAAREVLESLRSGPEARRRSLPVAPPQPLFASSCSCASPCAAEPPEESEGDAELEDLFGFYLEAMAPGEREVFEGQSHEFRQGFVLLQQGHCAEARPLLKEAARAGSDSPAPAYALGLLAGLEGDVGEAERQ